MSKDPNNRNGGFSGMDGKTVGIIAALCVSIPPAAIIVLLIYYLYKEHEKTVWNVWSVVYALAIGLALIVLPIIAPLMIIIDGFEKAWDENAAIIVLAIAEVLCILTFIIAVNLTDERRKKIGKAIKNCLSELKPIIYVVMIFGGAFMAVYFVKDVFTNEYSRSKNQSLLMFALLGAVCVLLPPYLMLNKTVDIKPDIENNEADEVKETYGYIKIGEFDELDEDDEDDDFDDEDDEFDEYDGFDEDDEFE